MAGNPAGHSPRREADPASQHRVPCFTPPFDLTAGADALATIHVCSAHDCSADARVTSAPACLVPAATRDRAARRKPVLLEREQIQHRYIEFHFSHLLTGQKGVPVARLGTGASRPFGCSPAAGVCSGVVTSGTGLCRPRRSVASAPSNARDVARHGPAGSKAGFFERKHVQHRHLEFHLVSPLAVSRRNMSPGRSLPGTSDNKLLILRRR